MKKKILIAFISTILTFTMLVLVANLIFDYLEVKRTEFSSFNEVEKSGYLKKGWIPADFPRNTLNIEETHNLDSNEVWIISDFNGKLKFGNRVMEVLNNLERKNYLIKYFKLKDEKIQYHSISDNEFIAIDTKKEKFYYYQSRQ